MAEKKGLIEEWIKIHKQLRPNSDVSIPQLPDILTVQFWGLGHWPSFPGGGWGPEAEGPKAETQKKVKVGSNHGSGKLHCLGRARPKRKSPGLGACQLSISHSLQ